MRVMSGWAVIVALRRFLLLLCYDERNEGKDYTGMAALAAYSEHRDETHRHRRAVALNGQSNIEQAWTRSSRWDVRLDRD